MTKIKIKNTNLELIKLDYYCRGTKEIIGLEKEKLKYQVVYFTNPVKDYKLLGSQRQAYGVSKFTLDANIYTIYDDAWVIQKTKKDPKEKDLEYDRYELATLLGVLHVMIFQHLDTAELICHAIGDGPLLNLFYSSFGNFKQFLYRIKELEERIESNNEEIKRNFSRIEGVMHNWREKDINDMCYESETISFISKEIEKLQNNNFIYRSQLIELKSWLENDDEE